VGFCDDCNGFFGCITMHNCQSLAYAVRFLCWLAGWLAGISITLYVFMFEVLKVILYYCAYDRYLRFSN
jgi:hypothetical protein